MRRTRGETGPRRRWAVTARRCAVAAWVWLPTDFFGVAGLVLAGFGGFACGFAELGVADFGVAELGAEDCAGDVCVEGCEEACVADACEGIAQLTGRAPPISTHTTPTAITHHNLRLNRTTLCLPRGTAPETLLKTILPLEIRTHDRNVVFGQAAN